tara:strand:- start:9550 stop:9786 length:237 start_codon:yes stop_codon:yes gene_type:complete
MSADSKIQVNSIEAFNPSGTAVNVSFGATVPSGKTLTVNGGVNATGVVTASNFVGDGSNLTELNIATEGKTIAFTIIG